MSARPARGFGIFTLRTWNICFVFSPIEIKEPNSRSARNNQFSISSRNNRIINSILIFGQLDGRRISTFFLKESCTVLRSSTHMIKYCISFSRMSASLYRYCIILYLWRKDLAKPSQHFNATSYNLGSLTSNVGNGNENVT